ncbi:hypothetical protein VC83_09191 [Pseudogymnoascus destructans]|uniref:Uncharacterized protein n=1 Tax=Pseudogymnoascus destructans TaxID=655981 RepID=A0A176ZXB3_9PEZI|nr:uncharacterized protein VC83_09191 [Pseudogymnoascus destructans]OAF54566.1 hypothetical protein VC83_09191 [Pseudogymnoascus destructans]
MASTTPTTARHCSQALSRGVGNDLDQSTQKVTYSELALSHVLHTLPAEKVFSFLPSIVSSLNAMQTLPRVLHWLCQGQGSLNRYLDRHPTDRLHVAAALGIALHSEPSPATSPATSPGRPVQALSLHIPEQKLQSAKIDDIWRVCHTTQQV